MAFSYGGYTTNLSLADLTGGRAWVVTEHEGRRSPGNTADPHGFWFRTSTSGRAPSGWPACG